MTERRNILQEAGRIARGKISSLDQLNENEFDGLILPGGFGVAKNLSTFAFKGAEARVHGTVASILKAFHQSKKPIGAICISPALLALTFGELHPTITLGSDLNIAKEIEKRVQFTMFVKPQTVWSINKIYLLLRLPIWMIKLT